MKRPVCDVRRDHAYILCVLLLVAGLYTLMFAGPGWAMIPTVLAVGVGWQADRVWKRWEPRAASVVDHCCRVVDRVSA